MKFTAGMAYKVSFDARLVSAYNDDKIDSAKLGICFHTKGVDKCVGTAIITADKWTHYAITYTVPDDYMYIVDDDRFGIYGEPVNDTSIVYLVDNITVIPLTEENLEAENKKLEEERIAAVDGLKTVYTINYNNGDDFITENIDELVYGENSATGKAQNADPKFTYKNTLDLNLDNIVALKIKAKIPDGALMQMFFGTSENLTLDEVKKYGIYSLGNYMTTYIIDTTSNPEWKGILKTFRLDPVSSVGQTFEVESVEFLSE